MSPNHLAYTSNPKETKELQGQVKELMVKYRLPISRLDDILDELHGSCVFTKIDLKSEHYHIRMKKKVMNRKLLLKLSIICIIG